MTTTANTPRPKKRATVESIPRKVPLDEPEGPAGPCGPVAPTGPCGPGTLLSPPPGCGTLGLRSCFSPCTRTSNFVSPAWPCTFARSFFPDDSCAEAIPPITADTTRNAKIAIRYFFIKHLLYFVYQS